MDLLDRNLTSISQIVPHLVFLIVHDGLLQGSDHLTFSLDELGLLLHSLEMCVENVFFGSEPLFFPCLLLHSHIHIHVEGVVGLGLPIALHHMVLLSRRVSWPLLRAHKRSRSVHDLLRRLIHLMNIELLWNNSRVLQSVLRLHCNSAGDLLGHVRLGL